MSKPSIPSDPFPSGEILLDDPPPDLRETAMRIVSAEAWRRRPGVIPVDRLFINPPAERSIPTRDAYAIGKTSIGTLRGEQPVGRSRWGFAPVLFDNVIGAQHEHPAQDCLDQSTASLSLVIRAACVQHGPALSRNDDDCRTTRHQRLVRKLEIGDPTVLDAA